MSTLVYMKILEQTPAGYDRWMRFLTVGRIDRIKSEIAGVKVMEVGCGTGSLAALMSKNGDVVTAIDISEKMLAEARKKVPTVEFIHLSALEINRLGADRFDRIIATLSFSKLSGDELDITLEQAGKLLKPGGLIVIADEVRGFTLRLCINLLIKVCYAGCVNSIHAIAQNIRTFFNPSGLPIRISLFPARLHAGTINAYPIVKGSINRIYRKGGELHE